MRISSHWTLRVLGVVLLTAAGLKVYGMTVEPFKTEGVFAAPWFQIALIYAEVLTGAWLILSGQRALKWMTAVVLFLSFAAVNLFQAVEGQASCGCLGVVSASPWLMIGIDAAIVTWLALCRPAFDRAEIGRDLRDSLKYVAGGFAVIAFMAAIVILWFGSLDAIGALIRGDDCTLSPHVLNYGSGRTSEVKTAYLTIRNWSSTPQNIVGGTADCTFVATLDLPVTVPANSEVALKMVIRFPATAGRFTHYGKLWIGDREMAPVSFQMTGKAESVTEDSDNSF